MSRADHLVSPILDTAERLISVGRTIARLGAGLDDDDVRALYHETIEAATGDAMDFPDVNGVVDSGADACDRAMVLMDAAYALGLAVGLHLQLAVIAPAHRAEGGVR